MFYFSQNRWVITSKIIKCIQVYIQIISPESMQHICGSWLFLCSKTAESNFWSCRWNWSNRGWTSDSKQRFVGKGIALQFPDQFYPYFLFTDKTFSFWIKILNPLFISVCFSMISYQFWDTSLCFVNCHLAAHDGQCEARNGNYRGNI